MPKVAMQQRYAPTKAAKNQVFQALATPLTPLPPLIKGGGHASLRSVWKTLHHLAAAPVPASQTSAKWILAGFYGTMERGRNEGPTQQGLASFTERDVKSLDRQFISSHLDVAAAGLQ